MNHLLVAQSGGPTAAINATLAGVVSCAMQSGKVDGIYGAVNGIEGVLAERMIDLRAALPGREELELLCQTPAAALGSCRFKLADPEKDPSQYEKLTEIFHRRGIRFFIYIGGNDSMDTVDRLSSWFAKKGITDIHVIGAPKTIDNDLVGTDHCPGFGSAARYIAATFAELERDCHVYTTKAVTIVEVMGRNAGWLTAASALSRLGGGSGPDLIYLCERPFDTDRFLADVREKLAEKDAVLVAVSEGVHDAAGRYLSEQVQGGAADQFGHSIIAGAAGILKELVRREIGCKVRSVELNLMQRCAAHIASAADLEESRLLGAHACTLALEGTSGRMAALERVSDEPYEVRVTSVPVSKASNAEKKVPDGWITPDGHDVTGDMLRYLAPLIQGEPKIRYAHGLPVHIRLV